MRAGLTGTDIVSSFVGGLISALLTNDMQWQKTKAVPAAMWVSEKTIMSNHAVSDEVTPKTFQQLLL